MINIYYTLPAQPHIFPKPIYTKVSGLHYIVIILLFITDPHPCIAQEHSLSVVSNMPAPSIKREIEMIINNVEEKHRDSAILLYKNLLQNSLKKPTPKETVHILHRLGILSAYQGTYTQAIQYHEKALANCDSTIPCSTFTDIHTEIGHAYYAIGLYQKATDSYIKAAGYAEHCENAGAPPAYLYNNIGAVMAILRQFEQAISYFNKAVEYGIKVKDTVLIANSFNNIGGTFVEMGQIDSGLKYLDSSIRLKRINEKPQNLYTSLVNMSLTYLRLNLPDSALRFVNEARAISAKHDLHHQLQYEVILISGKVFIDKKQYKKAEEQLSMMWEDRYSLTPQNRRAIMKYMAQLYQATGRYKQANAVLNEFIPLSDSLSGQEISLKVAEWEAYYRNTEKEKEITQNKLLLVARDKQLALQRLWMFVIIAFLGLTMISVLFYLRIKKKKLEKEREIERLKGIIEGEEKERERLAHELHDGVNSQLAVARILLHKMKIGYHYDYETLNKMGDVIEITDKEVRKVAHNLAPDDLLVRGLPAAIETYCTDLFTESSIRADVQVYDTFEDLPVLLQLNIYRIVQELAHNVVKHAEATEVTLLLHKEGNEIALTIDDNGSGISEENNFNGIGISSIRERVKAYNGSFQIDSTPGKGTHIQIRLSTING